MFAKVLFSLFPLLLALGLPACKPAPDAISSGGEAIRLSDYRGKWLFINYWATWCKPCLTEMPELNEFAKKYADQVVVIGVNFDSLPLPEIAEFGMKLSLSFPLVASFPLKERFGVEQVTVLPLTFVIAPDGKLKTTLLGPQARLNLIQVMKKNTDDDEAGVKRITPAG